MILAAGKGTRLQPLTHNTPKPMLPLAGKPLIEWQIEALQRAGVTDIIINLHHLGEQISEYLGNGHRLGVNISYSLEQELLETGGGIRRALPFFDDQPFLLLNGDIWTDFDFATLRKPPLTELESGESAHILLTPTPAHREQGDFEFAQHRVTARGTDYVYCGIAILHPKLFSTDTSSNTSSGSTTNAQSFRTEEYFSLRDLYFHLIPQGRLTAQIHNGVWHDIGTLAQYEHLRDALADMLDTHNT